jgi:hypothetical protein
VNCRHIVRIFLLLSMAAFVVASNASAATINYSTTGVGTLTSTGFGGGTSTLVFTGNPGASSGTPSIVNLGDFELVCTDCSTSVAGTAGATYAAGQTFQLNISDATDSATGHFTGTLGGGTVFSDSSPLMITWDGFVVDSGSFQSTVFTVFSPTPLAAPNSGSPAGDTTVQGHIDASVSAVPEPATYSLVGGALVSLGLWRRKKCLVP